MNLSLSAFGKIGNRVLALDIPEQEKSMVFDKAVELAETYYMLCHKYQITYGSVGMSYPEYDRTPRCYTNHPDGTQVHHIEQIWYDESINPKYSSSNDYKYGKSKAEISANRHRFFEYIMGKYSNLQGSHLLCFCSKDEHKELHNIIKEFQELLDFRKVVD